MEMARNAQRRIAEEAAQFMVDGTETEYLYAKERAVLMLGLSSHARMPSNSTVKEYIERLAKLRLGEEEVHRRLCQMRQIAAQIMTLIEDYDPFLIGSTLSGAINEKSDIDLHAYSDEFEIVKSLLADAGYRDIEEELIENRKGSFIHLRFQQSRYTVEITIYPWSWRDKILNSSITGKAMKRASLAALKHLLRVAL